MNFDYESDVGTKGEYVCMYVCMCVFIYLFIYLFICLSGNVTTNLIVCTKGEYVCIYQEM
jgi:hypothetical protein